MSKSLFNYFTKTTSDKARYDGNESAKESCIVSHGDIVWAKLDNFPWWPGMICDDPKVKSLQMTVGGKRNFHVQFFGKPPTHDWVNERCVTKFDRHQHTTNDPDLLLAYQQAKEALNLRANERLEKYYTCVDSDESDCDIGTRNNTEKDQSDEDCVVKISKKRPNINGHSKPRKRVKKLESDTEEEDVSDDDDRTYKPSIEDLDDFESGSSKSIESEEDSQSPPKKKKKKPAESRKLLKSLNSPSVKLSIAPVLNKMKTSNEAVNTPTTPLSNKVNSTLSNAKSKLSQFSSPSTNTGSPVDLDEEISFTHMNLRFLQDNQRKDKYGKLHSHSDSDKRTLHVPDAYINSKEVTPGMKQWWTLKKDLYDTIIFFKVGKFYELYHMDATVGVKELGLTYMKGKFAHCGFPEIAFSRYSEVLVQRGYKVARVEQTETPQAMSQRSAKVVRREVCAVITKGTRTFNFMEGQSDVGTSAYLLAFTEKQYNNITLGGSLIGVCFVDTSIGKFHIGQFKDDRQCSRLLTMIAQYPPVQVLYARNGISQKVNHILNHELLTAIKEPLVPDTEFWDSTKSLRFMHEQNYFVDEKASKFEWPAVIKKMLSNDDALGFTADNSYKLGISALGACIWYLKKCCIEEELLSMCLFEEYIPTDYVSKLEQKRLEKHLPSHMVLDGVTLSNLDIVTNSEGDTSGTLLELLDHCTTIFGKRYFKQWLCSPLCNKSAIDNRLNAVEDLMNVQAVTNEARAIMKSLPDLERILRRIHSLGSAKKSKEHPDSRALFYNEETYSKKKINDLLSALDGFNKVLSVVKLFQENIAEFRSSSIKRLLLKDERNDIGQFPDISSRLSFFQNSFDAKKAKDTGNIHPKPGVLVEYDSALSNIAKIKDKLDQYLKQQRKRLGCPSIVYWGAGKNRYQMEIPESALRSCTPGDYHLKSQKKGYKRYQSDEIIELNEELTKAEEQRDMALKDTMRNIFNKFAQNYNMWERAVQCLATLDCLMSLAYYSCNIDGVSCRPDIVDPCDANSNEIQPFFKIINSRHPCVRLVSGDDFIPNDIVLGKPQKDNIDDASARCVLITGPNMGGKSTLMRQAGMILIMAQLGCYVPAESCSFTPVDRVFTRLGARDRILQGESTFFVELSETSTIFQHATKHSLVLLDELGRGTATYDGTAIASAVVNELANSIGCRTLFSTHYHSLVEDFANNKNLKSCHMACMVEKNNDNDEDDNYDPCEENITFLYKLTGGACPKSYGFNAAKLAGLPLNVIKSAHVKAKEFEDSTSNLRKLRAVLNSSKIDLRKRLATLKIITY